MNFSLGPLVFPVAGMFLADLALVLVVGNFITVFLIAIFLFEPAVFCTAFFLLAIDLFAVFFLAVVLPLAVLFDLGTIQPPPVQK